MSANEQPTRPLGTGPLIAATLGALAAAALIVLGAILPAEFNRDPLGIGKLSGLSRLWAPDDTEVDANGGAVARAREYDIPYRTDVVEIPLGGFLDGIPASTLEYKVRMKKDATVVYSWTVTGVDSARDFVFDQHGHTIAKPGEGMTVSSYRKGFGLKQQGALSAPFDGIHGWLFGNQADGRAVVHLKLAGYYELIPGGQPGNEASVVANVPAEQARPDLKLGDTPVLQQP